MSNEFKKGKGGILLNYSLILYISICFMQLIILTNVTLLNNEWDGIMMWFCTAVFIFSSTIYGLSRQNKKNTSRD